MKVNVIFSITIFLLLPVNLLAIERNNLAITSSIKPYSVTIIGEQHGHSESIEFFQSLIKGELKKDNCLTVALEINNNQQPIIEKVMRGRAVASEIEIPTIINQPELGEMIDSLAELKMSGACLKLIAMDTSKGSRDEFMAAQLIKEIGDTPILALLGGLHSLKKVNWDLSMTKGHSYVAEILNKQSVNVSSYQQIWLDSECGSPKKLVYRFVASQSDEAVKLINEHFISMMNAYEFSHVSTVSNGIVVWECKDYLG